MVQPRVLPVLWGHGALRGSPPVSVDSVPMVWPQLFIQSHHVPLLPTVPRLPNLLDLPLQCSIHTTPLLLVNTDKMVIRPGYIYRTGGRVFQSDVSYFLLPLLFPLILCVLQHLLLPQVKEVRRICIELESFLVIIPKQTQLKIQSKKQQSWTQIWFHIIQIS